MVQEQHLSRKIVQEQQHHDLEPLRFSHFYHIGEHDHLWIEMPLFLTRWKPVSLCLNYFIASMTLFSKDETCFFNNCTKYKLPHFNGSLFQLLHYFLFFLSVFPGYGAEVLKCNKFSHPNKVVNGFSIFLCSLFILVQ